MKKSFLLLLSLFVLFASNLSIKSTNNVSAESISVTDKEYNASYHLSQMNASKKLLENYDGSGVKVAIIDSGININHEEFFRDDKLIVSDESVYVDTQYYYNLQQSYSNNRTAWLNALNDTTGHGTHVASLIAAQANGKGIIGVAPNVELVVIKMATNSDGLYEFATIRNSINYAYQIGADVINMSIAGYDTSDYYSSIIKSYDNTYSVKPIIVAAAGNDNVSSTYYPASASNIISIAATSKEYYYKPASFTNYGYIDFAAPGYTYGAYIGDINKYKEWQGTSFASPLVAGLAALYKQKYPDVTRDDFIEALKDTSTKITETSKYGWTGKGLVNADKLLDIKDATSLKLSKPTYPDSILDLDGNLIEQVLDLSDIGWRFDLNIEQIPSDAIMPKTHYAYTSNPKVIKIVNNKLEVVGPGTATIRVEAIEDPSVYGETTLTVENRNELEDNPLSINKAKGNTLTFEIETENELSILYNDNSWINSYGIWAEDENEYFLIDDGYFLSFYCDNGSKIYYQAIKDNGEYVIDYKIINVVEEITSSEEEEKLVYDIYDAEDDFYLTREDPADLSELKALVNDLKTRYENIENKDAIINSKYISHMEKAIDFLENEWYGVVRVRVTNKSSVKSLKNEEWTLCDAIQNKSIAMKVIEIYDSLDVEVQDILDEMYDITGTDGSIITIGKSLRYIKASLSVQSSGINDDNTLQTLKQNSMIIYITIGIASLLFVVACIIAVLIYKNKKKSLME